MIAMLGARRVRGDAMQTSGSFPVGKKNWQPGNEHFLKAERLGAAWKREDCFVSAKEHRT
jgi:hypothetical protein